MHSVACRVIYGLRLHSSTRSVVAMPRRYLSVQPSVKPAGVEDLAIHVDSLDINRAAQIYADHGCLIVRGLNREYVERVRIEADQIAAQSLALLEAGDFDELPAKDFPKGGWVTHDGTLFIPAPEGYFRDKQAMVLGMDYYTSAVMIQAALDTVCLDIVEALIGPDIELYGKGQILYKEPAGGFAKQMHQDAAYFDFAMDGPVGTLNYAIDTSRELGNGPLYVVPGSHKRGYMQHEDTDSHLALPEREYAFDEAICVDGEAGDTVFFHVHCVHGSTPNFSSSPRATFINRYVHPDDRQLLHATSASMREEGERGSAEMPVKERNLIVRGRRVWSGVKWDLHVQHH